MDNIAAVFSEGERLAFQAALLDLLAWQVRQYTAGESTSLPVETAQALLVSLCYSLGVDPEDPKGALPEGGLEEAWQAGQARIQRELAQGKALWQGVCRQLPPVRNQAMEDTLRSIGGFWRRYEPRFFAQEIPCDIDYQLALPVPPDRQGVDYVNDYLARLAAENAFLRRYSPRDLRPVLEAYHPNYRGEVLNLFAPVAANALGKALLGQPQEPLAMSWAEVEDVGERVRGQPKGILTQQLTGAAATLAGGTYLADYAAQLAAWLWALGEQGDLNGVFL